MGYVDFFMFFFLFHPFLLKLAYSKCPKSFTCNKLGDYPLGFPLTDHKQPECGLFKVDCDSSEPKITLGDDGYWYDFIERISTNRYVIRDRLLGAHIAAKNCISFKNMYPPDSPSISFTIPYNLTLFKCDKLSVDQKSIQIFFENYANYTVCSGFTVYYRLAEDSNLMEESNNIPEGCSVIHMPMNPFNEDSNDLFQLLTPEFSIEWIVSPSCLHCLSKGGQCAANSRNEFVCLKGNRKFKKIIILGGAIALSIASIILLVLMIWKKNGLLNLLGLTGAKTEKQKEIEDFLKNNDYLAPRRYKYSDLKKITKSFSDKLGKGGYGSVYKGKLQDGSLVAVKILHESKGNGEEFMNEVASISRTSHVNIVTLLGFCFEGSKRALIYEFLPNGSLEKYIPSTHASSAEGLLGWEKLFDIVVGVARGLEYLHQGCNMRILHFDIKPHNILLDKDLKPKISDFGLAKLCPNRSSIVSMSMLGARGTAGYIAPEVFCRNFGQVSHKSDIYSYGMMVLEMVLGWKNVEPQADQSSEMYFPDWIYRHLEQNVETGVDSIFAEEGELQFAKKKLIIIGLWCIQTEPKNRPSISRVFEMLEGKVESLQVPPRPYLSSSPRSIASFSASDST